MSDLTLSLTHLVNEGEAPRTGRGMTAVAIRYRAGGASAKVRQLRFMSRLLCRHRKLLYLWFPITDTTITHADSLHTSKVNVHITMFLSRTQRAVTHKHTTDKCSHTQTRRLA